MEMKSQSQKGGSMSINENECKNFTCITLEVKPFSRFAKEAEVKYDQLSKSLNGQQFWTKIREVFKKWNILFRSISSSISTINEKAGEFHYETAQSY
ncbi:hypothetical protein [Leptospira mayottensis]|uniref:hypothetical protein n=1 Tax=Leptospira mayottensis TaxID=1137606 RepID=UPI000E35E6BC|nr:hypothetical protein DPV73_04650 [Leptospira mayottensis]